MEDTPTEETMGRQSLNSMLGGPNLSTEAMVCVLMSDMYCFHFDTTIDWQVRTHLGISS
jgi:hypothetical protein